MLNPKALKKLRILMLNYEFPPLGGGASPVSYEIAKGYVKLGHSVDVVTMHYKGLPFYEEKDGIHIYRVKCIRKKKEMCTTLEMFTYVVSAKHFLKAHLKTHNYDINHTHFIIPTGIVSLWAKKKFGLPYIITSHGSDVPGYNSDRFKLAHFFTKPLLRKVCNGAKIIISPSSYLSELIKNKIGNYKIKLIANGVEISKFMPKKKEKIILSTGRLLKRKGFQYLIKAVSDKDYGYMVHIAGDGPMMNELKVLAKKSKTKVFFHGWLNNKSQEYKNLLESASIYILASEKENASVSLLEAMSAGCAVITTNVSGCPETVGEAGLVFEPRNITELRNKINYVIKNSSKMVALQKRARKRIVENYDWNRLIKKYEGMFQ